MAILGIDIGTSYCVLATVKNGTITIVRNDLSERLTPALVSYTEKERLVGEAAQSQIRSNFRNTARYIKQLLGSTADDPSNEANLRFEGEHALAPIDVDANGLVGYRINYKGEDRVFSATCALAALLTKLREIGEKALASPVQDVVISCPSWFSDRSRQAVKNAAEIAGLNCTRVMSEHAAVALDYGIYRATTFSDKEAKRVAFVSVGHGTTSVFVVDFKSNELRVVASESDKTVGGRVFDRCIVECLAAEFSKKYGCNPLTDRKALLKLEDAATKAKKILSANSEAPINVECLMEDYDLSALITRDLFEQMCEEARQRFVAILERTFAGSNIDLASVESLEIVGGCTRIPFVQRTIEEFFGKRLPISKTLNMDETVARGCALQAAMLDPRYRVREFRVHDVMLDPVYVAWKSNSSENGIKENVLFERGTALGTKRWLTFNKTEHFDLQIRGKQLAEVLQYSVQLPEKALQLDPTVPRKIKIRAKLSSDGIVSLEDAQVNYEVQEEVIEKERRPVSPNAETEKAEAPSSAAENEGNAAAAAAAPMTDDAAVEGAAGATTAEPQYVEVEVKKMRTLVKTLDCILTLAPRRGFLEPTAIAALIEAEHVMLRDDRECQAAREIMNSLESYIYAARENVYGVWAPYLANEQEKARIIAELDAVQSWVYDNLGASKAECEAKYAQIKEATAGPAGQYEAVLAAAEKAAAEQAAAERAAAEQAAAAAAAEKAAASSAEEQAAAETAATAATSDPADA